MNECEPDQKAKDFLRDKILKEIEVDFNKNDGYRRGVYDGIRGQYGKNLDHNKKSEYYSEYYDIGFRNGTYEYDKRKSEKIEKQLEKTIEILLI